VGAAAAATGTRKPGNGWALWRLLVVAALVVVLAVLAGVAQTASAASSHKAPPASPPGLLDAAKAHPDATFHVIVRGRHGASSADVAGQFGNGKAKGKVGRRFKAINGVAADLSGAALTALAKNPHVLSIFPDAPVQSTGLEEASLWRAETHADGVPSLLEQSGGAQPPAIAVVDSGVDPSKADDFGTRLVASVNLQSTATGDDEGHGTMVAGIAAGASESYPGVASTAPIVSIRTADANGASRTSDVIAGIDWILQNQSTYNIRVANFSMAGGEASSFTNDPLDAAVEQLWFHGIVVVAAVGNYGAGPVDRAPGNDPFVISVGALDTNGTADPADDFAAPWSAHGHTGDGFAKPELSAPGRWIVAPVPDASTLATTAPDRVVAPGYMWMSGTSLAAPVVSAWRLPCSPCTPTGRPGRSRAR
jgi:serine protease AprX